MRPVEEDWLGAAVDGVAGDDVRAGDWVGEVELVDGDPPQAVRLAPRASPAAYESACRGVGVLTLRSVGNRF